MNVYCSENIRDRELAAGRMAGQLAVTLTAVGLRRNGTLMNAYCSENSRDRELVEFMADGYSELSARALHHWDREAL